MGERWGTAGPPREAYSRVTDPDRYVGLHVIGKELLDGLERRYVVSRQMTTEPDQHGTTSAPVTRLVPADPAAAPLEIVFDAYPGLLVRLGRDSELHLPVCGCDACDETVQDCAEQLRNHAEAVTAGTLGERLLHDGGWWHERWYQTPRRAWSTRTPLTRPQRKALRALLPGGELRWAPWSERS